VQPGVIAVTDVHYPASGGARAAAVLSRDPRFEHVVAERVAEIATVADYQPGRFYLRELPPLLAVLKDLDLSMLLVDGYVDLEPGGRRPGLGAHCHTALGVPVIGVAKTRFQSAVHALEVRRGAAIRPLWVTAVGLDLADAADLVTRMAGPFRLPDAIKRVDALARASVMPVMRIGPG
jgi:deoxyribonuclease V